VSLHLRVLAGLTPQLTCYTLVSALALSLDFALFIALTRLGVWAPLAGVLGYAAGTVLHYLLSVRFVFDAGATGKRHSRLLAEFAVTGVSGMAVTALVIAAATSLVGLPALAAKVMAAGVSFLLVFALRRTIVFSKGDSSSASLAGARALQERLARKLATSSLQYRLYAWCTVGGAALFASAEIAYFLFSPLPSFHLPSVDGFGGTAIGRDFLNTWMGGRAALSEGPAAWFEAGAYNEALRSVVAIKETYYWSYPPHVLLFIWPLGLMPYLAAFALWTLAGFVLFLGVAARSGIPREHLWFVAVAPAVAVNVLIGQNGFFTAALLIGGLISLDRRPYLAGILFGVLTTKPQLGLLLPLMLVVSGRWRAIASAGGTTAALIGLTCFAYGPDIWGAYLDSVVPAQRALQEHGGGMLLLQIPSAFNAGRLAGLPLAADWALQLVVSAAAAVAVIWTFRRRRDPLLSVCLLVTATFLFAPYSMNYDMVVLAWVCGLLRQHEDSQLLDHCLIVLLWSLPLTMMLAGAVQVPLALPVLVAAAARILWRLARPESRVARSDFEPARGSDRQAA
jgi:alpha-1,2-mannosyltransferase